MKFCPVPLTTMMERLGTMLSISVPPKEGRSQSYRPRSPQRVRTTTKRFIFFIFLILLSYSIFISQLVPFLRGRAGTQESTATDDPKEDAIKGRAVFVKRIVKTAGEEALPTDSRSTLPKPPPHRGIHQHVINNPNSPHAQAEKQSFKVKPSMAATDDSSLDKVQFKAALQHVSSILPDEMQIRELLRPIEGTGKEKLREVGLRARAFKKFFDAWEKLHFVSGADDTHVRDDIVHQLRTHPDLVSSIGLAQTIHNYEAYRYFLQHLGALLFPWITPYYADYLNLRNHLHKGGRGIVFTAGDEQAPYLLASIPSFRKLGCTLPIEIMYLGDSDLAEDYRAELETMPGVVTRDLSQMVNDKGWKLAGWAAKPFAILHSTFRDVIFVDADALFFQNPEVLLDDPVYEQLGALFFTDRQMMPESRKRWLQQILPKPISEQVRKNRFWTGKSGHMQESGVVVVDTWRHFVAMLLVARMNGPDRDGNEDEHLVGVYDMVYGDKETFWIAWELIGDIDYAFHAGATGIMGQVKDQNADPLHISEGHEKEVEPDDHETDLPSRGEHSKIESPQPANASQNFTVCAPQLLHLGTDGRPLWFNGWLLSNKFADKKQRQAGTFDVYMQEPQDMEAGDEDAWQLVDNNVCCLTSDRTHPFNQAEKETLGMIASMAKIAGAYGKQ